MTALVELAEVHGSHEREGEEVRALRVAASTYAAARAARLDVVEALQYE